MTDTDPAPLPRPSAGELEILHVLWKRGSSTVREVWRELDPSQDKGYTTVLKLMQIMAQKGLVRRDETERAHRYEAVVSGEEAQRQFVGDLLNRVFMGNAPQLLLRALESKHVSEDELKEIRTLLDEYERRNR